MFAQQLNQIRLDLSITPRGPLLIRSGRTGIDPTRPDLECVRTFVGGRPSVYLPGSSLKGIMRAHAERLLRSEQIAISDTFANQPNGIDQKTPGHQAYAASCPVGRTFGNLAVKGRVGVGDHTPGGHEPPGSSARQQQVAAANRVERRNGVGIDRLLGSAKAGALFDQEVVVQGRFDGRMVLRNVQLYQLTLVLLVLRDLDAGYLQLGSGTSRGNGLVGCEIRRIEIETRRGHGVPGQLVGAGSLQGDERYQLFGGDQMALPQGIESTTRLLWDRLLVSGEHIDLLAEGLVAGPWTAFVKAAKEHGSWAA